MVPFILSPSFSNSKSILRVPGSHYGGMEKLYLPPFTLISVIGRALPKAYSKRPISTWCEPDFCNSNHEGRLLPALSMVISHLPITLGSCSTALAVEKENIIKIIDNRTKRPTWLWFKIGFFIIGF